MLEAIRKETILSYVSEAFSQQAPPFLSGMDLVYHARLLFSCQSDYIEMKKWLQNDCIGGQNALNF